MDNMSERIKNLRAERKMTLEDVAKIVGVGKSTVRKWETGMIANMRRDKIALLAKALGTTPMHLMGWDTPKDEKAAKAKELLSRLSDDKLEEAISFLTYLASKEDK